MVVGLNLIECKKVGVECGIRVIIASVCHYCWILHLYRSLSSISEYFKEFQGQTITSAVTRDYISQVCDAVSF
jgi:hypothetical protein